MNQKGSTLIENVISIFLLAIFALMVGSSVVAGMKALDSAHVENQRLYTVYEKIEQGDHSTTEVDTQTSSKMTYTFQGTSYEIGGTAYYDSEKEILGEFVYTP